MVKVTIKVRSGAAHFRVGVRAQSIQRALSLVGARYQDAEVRVRFPIEAEGFFIRDPTALAEMVGHEQTYQEAA